MKLRTDPNVASRRALGYCMGWTALLLAQALVTAISAGHSAGKHDTTIISLACGSIVIVSAAVVRVAVPRLDLAAAMLASSPAVSRDELQHHNGVPCFALHPYV